MTLIELINERVDPDELIDVLGLSTEDLTVLLYDVILTMSDRFDYLTEDDECEED